jgi:hypothetical protein
VATPPYDLYAHRYVAGAKVRLVDTLTAQVNVARQHGLREAERNSLDVAFTYVFRFDARRSRE